MVDAASISIVHKEPLTLFLAMEREVFGRRPWELCLLPRPLTPEVGLFATGRRMLHDAGITGPPAEAAEAADMRSFASSLAANREQGAAQGWRLVCQSLAAVEDELRAAVGYYAPSFAHATTYIEETLLSDEQRWTGLLATALGVAPPGRPLPVYLVPFAPYPPGAAFFSDHGVPRASYLDYRRFSGPTMLEGLLTLLSWSLLASSTSNGSLSRMVATKLSGSSRADRRLRAVLIKTLIALTAEHIIGEYEPRFPGTIIDFGHDLRFPRLLAAARTPWQHFLQGRTSQSKALALITERLAGQPASWYVEQIDAASLAADFYLLEWLAAQGDHDAAARLAAWQPQLAAGFARHIDYAIGAELVHYDGIPLTRLTSEMSAFVEQICEGNSLLRWPSYRRGAGADAYQLAEQAFAGPGAEYGGDAWAPIARLMYQYSDGTLSERVFIDQCFTMEHNNGCLFDKFFDTWDMQPTLQAQAQGDLDILATHASAEVRHMLDRRLGTAGLPPNGPGAAPAVQEVSAPRQVRLVSESEWAGGFHQWPPPGRAGCGSSTELLTPGGRIAEDPAKPLFRGKIRKPMPRDVPTLRSVTAVLHTSLGPLTLKLDPTPAPQAVGTFVQLARGEVAWRDPATGGMSTGPFYDGTRFHRIVPGFLLQAGDRTETGRGGPGFRYDEEFSNQQFDRPYLVAMVNTGIVTNGSQFFITLVEAPHLDGQYTVIGELAGDGSAEVAWQLSDAAQAGRQDLHIKHVEVAAA